MATQPSTAEHHGKLATGPSWGADHVAKTSPRLGRSLWIFIAFSLGVHVMFLIAGHTFLQDWRWLHPPAHTAIEVAGGLIALWVAWMLVSLERRQVGTSFNIWIAGALIGMGLLDELHALVHVGQEFVWLHSTATFTGGILFAMVWAPKAWAQRVLTWWPWTVFIVVLSFGFLSLAFPDSTPRMLVQNEQGELIFSLWAQGLNVVGGVLLFAAAVRLLTTYFQNRNVDDLWFCLHCSLFGAAAIMFEQSRLWDLPWWGWHLLRLMAYGVALWFVVLTESREQRALVRLTAESRRASRQLRSTVEAAPAAMVMIDRQGTIVLTNGKAEQVFGYSRGELLGHLVDKIVPARFRAGHPQLRSDFFARPEARNLGMGRDLYGVRKDGCEFPIEIGLSPVETDEGLFALSVIVDITENKRLQEAQRKLNEELEKRVEERTEELRESEEKYHDLFENASDLIQSVAPDGSFDYINPAWKMALGYSDEEVANLSMFDVIHPDSQAHCQEMFQRIMAGEKLQRIEAKFVTKNGGSITVEGSSSCKFDSGKPVSTRGIFRDITARKHAEQLLVQQSEQLKVQRLAALNLAEDAEEAREKLARVNEALEQSNIELQQFAYVASHDLQTPLRSIAGFAQFLQKDYQGQLDEQADDYINRMVGGVTRMQTMIRDLLAYSRVESRSAMFQPVDLILACADAVELLQTSIEDADGKVTHDELPTIAGDRSQLTQLLQNLIGNGIKYHSDTPPHVHVSVERNGDSWTIAVRDNGIGIGAKYHEQIFEIFRRLHTEREYPGTGIGLAVCRRIVHRHGGRIWLESEPGKGSTFYFTIPVDIPKET